MNCTTCKTGNMIESTTAYFTQINDYYVIIENVPCLKCDVCGEEFFKTSTAKRLEQIIHELKNITEKVSIIDFNQSAA